MKIALVGTGRMGQAVEAVATSRGHVIVARFNSGRPLASASGPAAMAGAEVAIDFSLPSLVVDHVRQYCTWHQPAVIGATGWYEALPDVEALVASGATPILYAPNFSLGIAVLNHALRAVGPILDRLPEFDAALHEVHHTGKVDRPSGTALALAETLIGSLERKKRLETTPSDGRVDPEALLVTSSRIDSVFGEHTVTVDSPFDQVVLSHAAKNRQGFALGAVKAAEWLPGHKGLLTLADVLQDWL